MSGPRRPLTAAALAASVAVAADVALFVASPEPPSAALIVAHAAIAGAWIGAGMIAWARRPALRTGPLMVLQGVLWLGLQLYSWRGAPAVTFASTVDAVGAALAAHLFLGYPTGRLGSRTDRALVGAAYVDALVIGGLVRQLFVGPGNDWCTGDCGPNLVLVHDSPSVADGLGQVAQVVAIALGVVIAWRLAQRWRTASGPGRAALGPVLLTGAFAIVSNVAVLATIEADTNGPYQIAVLVGWVAWGLVPLAFLLGLLNDRLRRSAMTRLMLELAELPPAPRVRDALARALGDPSLALYFRLPGDVYLDLGGTGVDLDSLAADRALTPLEHRGECLAVLAHDPFVLEDPELVEAVGAAALLAIENARLQAELRAQLEEVRASRARIVEAGDAERQRIERDLHDGAQQRLVAIRLALRLARGRLHADDGEVETLLAEADDEMRAAVDELRALARGIHPAVLTDKGLAAALGSLARRSPVPVELHAVPTVRLPAPVEAAAYFVTSEALANIAKHAQASRATIDVSLDEGWLRLDIADDGVGGANGDAGSGLSGLRDRVAALDGRLEVVSPRGGGTRLHAELPA